MWEGRRRGEGGSILGIVMNIAVIVVVVRCQEDKNGEDGFNTLQRYGQILLFCYEVQYLSLDYRIW